MKKEIYKLNGNTFTFTVPKSMLLVDYGFNYNISVMVENEEDSEFHNLTYQEYKYMVNKIKDEI